MRNRPQRRLNDERWSLAHQAYQRLKRGQSTLAGLPEAERQQLLTLWVDLLTNQGSQGRATFAQKLGGLSEEVAREVRVALAPYLAEEK